MARLKASGPARVRGRRCFVLSASLGIFMFHDQEGLLRLDAKQLTRGELMIEPIDRSILQIREWIMARSARQLVFAKHGLLLPGVLLFGRIGARPVPMPVPALHRLATATPGRAAPRTRRSGRDMY